MVVQITFVGKRNLILQIVERILFYSLVPEYNELVPVESGVPQLTFISNKLLCKDRKRQRSGNSSFARIRQFVCLSLFDAAIKDIQNTKILSSWIQKTKIKGNNI